METRDGNYGKTVRRAVERLAAFALCAALALSLCLAAGCSAPASGTQEGAEAGQDDIVILFTNDVHCGIADDIGYAGLVAYREKMEAVTPHVTLVDLGDAVQGDAIGMVSQGEYLVDIMNEAGYDLAIFGNHEFDYGMEQLSRLVDMAEFSYLNANISYHGDGDTPLEGLMPRTVVDYGDISVGFIGVTTPYTTTSSSPGNFMEDGEYVYDFAAGNDGIDLYGLIQDEVAACRAEGADYVVLLGHLGDLEESVPYSSLDVARNTEGIDVILDGHAHSVIPCRIEKNLAGEDVLISSTGTKLNNIGQLTISANGTVTVGLVSDYDQRDAEMEAYLEDIVSTYEEDVNTVVATSDVALSINDENGVRLVRNRETAIGNLVADAYRAIGNSDIALVNGGGIRADLPAGDITYGDAMAVHPFGNMLCTVETTGQDILDSLEVASRLTQAEASADGQPLGEDGTFQHVSGLRYTIDTSVASPVVLDENGMLEGFEGERRVKDVQVQGEDGTWTALDPAATYTLTSHNYLIKEAGDGIPVFQDDVLLADETMLDYQVLITYIADVLQGQLGTRYSVPEGRITVL